ncbi:uncharacterized protein MONBRDRAFT_27633 [Monosiga brevicollis MX1]|uniref:Sulfatase N-terminal domain-containing protein n=1 Tax=Monosiga brevicollis TaxID=81824 RepID=A9V5V3_MONBE|nr:uncharacterized protein MONBRDRAFT_27633 [Monosiga brevicollis MX1]EDQ87110.1 predicted protein [Monosiga brevicollis MX1]|eukprot:XP_001748053.1 hypothetical protein [Monosiga brevicollis MX1]
MLTGFASWKWLRSCCPFHAMCYSGPEPRSWSQTGPDGSPWPFFNVHGENGTNACPNNCCGANDTAHYCLWDLSQGALLEDQINNAEAASRLQAAAKNFRETGQPFFLGQGYHRPHLPWIIPKPFYDAMETPTEATHQAWPADRPAIHFHDCAEMSHPYWDTNGWGVPLDQGDYFASHQGEMRRAYYAAVSYIDSLMGDLLQVLDTEGIADDTIVLVMGDHAFMMRAPFMPNATGKITNALAEVVDIYPTLVELAGLQLPTGAAGEYLGGTSLKPVLEDPTTSVKKVALSQFPRCWQNNTQHPSGNKPGDENNQTVSWESMSDCHWTYREGFDFMGYRMRTEEWALTQWVRWNGTSLRPNWNQTVGLELYDHRNNTGMAPSAFDDFENENLAYEPALQPVLMQLLEQLHQEFAKWWTPNP